MLCFCARSCACVPVSGRRRQRPGTVCTPQSSPTQLAGWEKAPSRIVLDGQQMAGPCWSRWDGINRCCSLDYPAKTFEFPKFSWTPIFYLPLQVAHTAAQLSAAAADMITDDDGRHEKAAWLSTGEQATLATSPPSPAGLPGALTPLHIPHWASEDFQGCLLFPAQHEHSRNDVRCDSTYIGVVSGSWRLQSRTGTPLLLGGPCNVRSTQALTWPS